tara:strand:- start:232 stop:705 length:474 start_codon:yes stop_codon:yes gene_type:complete
MGDKKKTYKELNGTTRVGDFLRTINKSGVLGKIVGAAGEIATGDLMGAIEALTVTKELSPEEKEHALKLLEMDIEEAKAITKRWESDMQSDSWLSKNVRPLTLCFLTVVTMLFVALDSSTDFEVDEVWVDLLKTLLVTTYLAYFGSRGVEKYKKISK